MHELANPVQAARTSLRLWHDQNPTYSDSQIRIQGLDAAYERIAMVIRSIQAVKESSVLPATAVFSDRFRTDILFESATFGIKTIIEKWPDPEVNLRLHGAAIPLLLSCWAAVSKAETENLLITLQPSRSEWELSARLRKGEDNAISRESTAIAVAGYPAAIGEFMIAAGGKAFVREDNHGAFELVMHIAPWIRDDKN